MKRILSLLALTTGLGIVGWVSHLIPQTGLSPTAIAQVTSQPKVEPGLWHNCTTREVWSPAKQAWCRKVNRLKNARYQLPALGTVQLNNGLSRPSNQNSLVSLIDEPGTIHFGDVNQDGKEDAVVLLATNQGGEASWVHLATVLDVARTSQPGISVRLGDRVKAESVAIADQRIQLAMIQHRPGDPQCCPTEAVTQTYILRENKLVLLIQVYKPTPAISAGQAGYQAIDLARLASRTSLVGLDPKAIALAAFGNREKSEGAFQETVTVDHRDPKRAVVLITQTGLADDSVYARRYRVEFEPTVRVGKALWRMQWAGQQYRCQPNRGAQDWTTDLCV